MKSFAALLAHDQQLEVVPFYKEFMPAAASQKYEPGLPTTKPDRRLYYDAGQRLMTWMGRGLHR